MLFLAIPTGRFIDAYPVNISLAVGCSFDGLTLTDLDSINCDFKPSANLSLTVEECGYLCLDSQPGHFQETNASLPADWPGLDQQHHKFRNGLFFREDWIAQIDCWSDNCKTHTEKKNRPLSLNQVTLRNTSFNIFHLQLNQSVQCDAEYDRPVRLIQPLTFALNNSLKSNEGVLSFSSLDSEPSTDTVINYKICHPQCLVRAPRSDICANKEHVVVFDPQLTFWVYILLRLMWGILMGGVVTLFEGACLAVVTEVKGDLGLQRIFGLCGLMILSPVTGVLIDHFSIGKSIPDFK